MKMSAQMKRMVSSIEIEIDGHAFLEIYRDRPHQISKMSPKRIQAVELCDGEWGKEGSVLLWRFTQDGKKKTNKATIEEAAKNSVTYGVFEGAMMEAYKTFTYAISVDKVGHKNVVTWTLEYEKQDDSFPDPDSMMKICLNITKDIEAYNLSK